MIRLNAKGIVCVIAVCLAIANVTASFAQVVTGSVLGRVTDSSGAVLPGAMVQIQNAETGYSQTAQTDSGGRYLARNLPLGTYTVTVQQPGFRTEVRSGIVISVASEATVNVELAVGNVQEKVEVTAEAPSVETTSATLSGLVSPEQIRDLPLNGRSVDQLALLSPGVFANRQASRNNAVGVGMHLSVNGARPDSTLYLLDGTVANDYTNNGRGSAAGQSLGVEGILEFRLLTHNFSAEYGRNAGGVVSAVTRSGTNELHGSVYEFVRNNIFDARNFFNVGDLPAFRRNQFGAAAGGRLIKDRVFFFANYEGLRQVQGNPVISSVPDAATRLLAAPVAAPYVNLYPLPNGKPHGDGTSDYNSVFKAPATEDYAMERMDFRLSDKDSFYWRYVYDPSFSNSPLQVPIFNVSLTAIDHFAVLSETHIFSGASLNEFRAAFNRTNRIGNTDSSVPIDPALWFVPGSGFGTISFASANFGQLQLSTLGVNNAQGLQVGLQNLFEETDTFSTVRGAHSLKFGVDVERVDLNYITSTQSKGNYQFGGLQSLLDGKPTSLRILIIGGNSSNSNGYRRILFGWFVQDDYRLRPNLTLNIGLRHEFFTDPTEVNGKTSALRHVTDAKNTPGPPFDTPKMNFAPRLGLAWDPTGSGKTSVRLGAGLFYNHVDGRSWANNAINNADFIKTYQIATPPFPNALAAGNAPGALQTNQQIQFNSDTPTVIHYNLEVQRQITPTLSLRAGYVGSHGYNLTREAELNTKIPTVVNGIQVFPATGSGSTYNPNFASLLSIMTDAQSNYNGLQIVLQKNISAGLRFQASYTYSKAMSNADEITTGQTLNTPPSSLDPYDVERDYSLSVYDQRHNFVWSGVYDLPFDRRLSGRLAKAVLGGWAINGIFSYGSGLPVTIQDGFNNSRDGDTNQPDRPDLTPGFSNNPVHGVTAGCTLGGVTIPAGQPLRTTDHWYDPCAFSLPTAGTFGNLGRATVTAPGLKNVDFTLVKTTSITERKKLEFRAEVFNLFNHTNFAIPNLNVFNSSRARVGNAGNIISTNTDNREIQLGMKLIF